MLEKRLKSQELDSNLRALRDKSLRVKPSVAEEVSSKASFWKLIKPKSRPKQASKAPDELIVLRNKLGQATTVYKHRRSSQLTPILDLPGQTVAKSHEWQELDTLERKQALGADYKDFHKSNQITSINIFGLQNVVFNMNVSDMFGLGALWTAIMSIVDMHQAFLERQSFLVKFCIIAWEVAITSLIVWQFVKLVGMIEMIVMLAHRIIDDGVGLVEGTFHLLFRLLRLK